MLKYLNVCSAFSYIFRTKLGSKLRISLQLRLPWRAYAKLMRLDRPIGFLLLLWPTLWALWIASNNHPSPRLVLIFVAGAALMRSAGCVINDYVDRRFDGQVARTRHRPLVTGEVSTRAALILCAFLCVLGASLLLLLPALARWLAIPTLILLLLYPYMKRITHLPQLVLGVAFSAGVPMAFAAQTGRLPGLCWFVFLIACLWPIAYDTIYAMVDKPDDLTAGIKSTAILWGDHERTVVAGLHLLMLLLLVLLGIFLSNTGGYYLSLGVAAAIMAYQQYLIRDRMPARCFRAFLMSQWVGCAVFVGIMLG